MEALERIYIMGAAEGAAKFIEGHGRHGGWSADVGAPRTHRRTRHHEDTKFTSFQISVWLEYPDVFWTCPPTHSYYPHSPTCQRQFRWRPLTTQKPGELKRSLRSFSPEAFLSTNFSSLFIHPRIPPSQHNGGVVWLRVVGLGSLQRN